MLGNYQASRMSPQTWRVLHHIADIIGGVGGAEYLHVGMFESAHSFFRENTEKACRKENLATVK